MSVENNQTISYKLYDSAVPQDEGEERRRIITSANNTAMLYHDEGNKYFHEGELVSPSSNSNIEEYDSNIPNVPEDIPFSYRKNVPSFHALQEWEGYVTTLLEAEFEAELIDLTSPSSLSREKGFFDYSELSEESLNLLSEGAVFRWSIGYETSPSGTKQRVSRIVFRRLPAWKKSDLEKARIASEEICKNITWK